MPIAFMVESISDAHVLQGIDRVEREVAALDGRAVAQVAHARISVSVFQAAVDGVDLVGDLVRWSPDQRTSSKTKNSASGPK
jgi:hypothetical protein